MEEDTQKKKIRESYEKLIVIEENIRRCSNELAEASEYYDSV